MTPFIITGLPRSRTAWLANLFTTGTCFCLHDGINEARGRLEELGLILSKLARRYAHVGNSDSSMVLDTRWLALWPDARICIVRRPWIEAADSFIEFFARRPYRNMGPMPGRDVVHGLFRAWDDKLQQLLAGLPRHRYYVIDYDNLNCPQHVRSMWAYLVDAPFCEDRFKLLDKLRVETTPEKIEICPELRQASERMETEAVT